MPEIVDGVMTVPGETILVVAFFGGLGISSFWFREVRPYGVQRGWLNPLEVPDE